MSLRQCCPAQAWTLVDVGASSVCCQRAIRTHAETDGPYDWLPMMLSPLPPLEVSKDHVP